MQEMRVAGGLIESDAGVLLVCNRRRNGREDWTPPGGVIDPTDSDMRSGLTREVAEETSLHVATWEGPCYRVSAEAATFGWHLTVEVFRAVAVSGTLAVDDPDGIVVDAGYFAGQALFERVASAPRWVTEPLTAWLDERWSPEICREFQYAVSGTSMHDVQVERL